jgi:nucleoside-diphosphate-sugar epimerase
MYTILVVGAGYVGSEIATYFKDKKQKVYGLTRNIGSAISLEKKGIQPIIADLSKAHALEAIPDAHFVVLSVAPDESTEDDYRKTYLEGICNFLESRRNKLRPNLIVYLSSTSVWKDRAGDWVEEATPPDADSEKAKILIAAEDQVLNSGFPSIVFRLGGIYGPHRNRIKAIESGLWPKSGENEGYMNLIHRDDIVNAIPLLFKKAELGQVYSGVDNEPVLRSEFYRWICEQTEKEKTVDFNQEKITEKRCSNKKIKALGYDFLYPSFREGYASLFSERKM